MDNEEQFENMESNRYHVIIISVKCQVHSIDDDLFSYLSMAVLSVCVLTQYGSHIAS